MKKMRSYVLFAFLVFLAGCFPKDIKETANRMPERIKSTKDSVNRQVGLFNSVKKGDDYKSFLELYAEREKWQSQIDQAVAKMKLCEEIHGKLVAIVKSGDEKKVQEARTLITRFSTAVSEAKSFSVKPYARIEFLRNVKKQAPEMMKTASSELASINKIIEPLMTFVAKVRNEFPNKDEDIATRFKLSEQYVADTKAKFAIVDAEFKASAPDYAKFGDSCIVITANLKGLTGQDAVLRKKLAELSRSYSKILVDMRADHYIIIARCSWDDYSDWNTEKDYTYPAVKVDDATFDYFTGPSTGLSETFVPATYGIGWGSKPSVKCNGPRWAALKVDYKRSWPSGHDEATYWISDWYDKCYHKYIIEENGVKKETDWVEVDDEDYIDWQDDLGMEIVSKLFGLYEDEVLEESAPPGLSKVGNPKYGKWEKDANDEEHWSFYETYFWYNMMFGGNTHYYSRGMYTDYDRNYRGKGSYYGTTKSATGVSTDKYGTRSKATQAKYAGSNFSKSGGMKRQASSVRSAGRSSRGGGPGSGGK